MKLHEVIQTLMIRNQDYRIWDNGAIDGWMLNCDAIQDAMVSDDEYVLDWREDQHQWEIARIGVDGYRVSVPTYIVR